MFFQYLSSKSRRANKSQQHDNQINICMRNLAYYPMRTQCIPVKSHALRVCHTHFVPESRSHAWSMNLSLSLFCLRRKKRKKTHKKRSGKKEWKNTLRRWGRSRENAVGYIWTKMKLPKTKTEIYRECEKTRCVNCQLHVYPTDYDGILKCTTCTFHFYVCKSCFCKRTCFNMCTLCSEKKKNSKCWHDCWQIHIDCCRYCILTLAYILDQMIDVAVLCHKCKKIIRWALSVYNTVNFVKLQA